jgi:hypothetical protein
MVDRYQKLSDGGAAATPLVIVLPSTMALTSFTVMLHL